MHRFRLIHSIERLMGHQLTAGRFVGHSLIEATSKEACPQTRLQIEDTPQHLKREENKSGHISEIDQGARNNARPVHSGKTNLPVSFEKAESQKIAV